MHLVIGTTPDADWQRLTPLLEHLGFRSPPAVALERWREAEAACDAAASDSLVTDPASSTADPPPTVVSHAAARRAARAELLATCAGPTYFLPDQSPAMLAQWLTADEAVHLLLCVREPLPSLASALSIGTKGPSAALQDWLASASALAHLRRHHRQRTLLVDIDQAIQTPNVFLQACRKAWKLQGQPWLEKLTSTAPLEPIAHLLAAHQIAQSPNAIPVATELRGAAVDLGASLPRRALDCDHLWADVGQSLRQAKAQQAKSALGEAQETKSQSTNRNPSLEEENELLLAQLHQIQEELEHHYLRSLEVSRSPETQHCCDQLQRMRGTLSWRITAPLRWGFKPLKKTISSASRSLKASAVGFLTMRGHGRLWRTSEQLRRRMRPLKQRLLRGLS